MVFKLKEVEVKKIITRSNIPEFDFAINPYIGCSFACSYCYASFMSQYSGEKTENWGQFLSVKKNAVELFKKELRGITKKNPFAKIMISSATDAWQYHENRYKLTRGILQALVKNEYLGEIFCLSKSDLITRDIDLFKQLNNAVVGITITSTEDEISKSLEGIAPVISKRLKALKKLNEAGLKTIAFVSPIMPHFHIEKSNIEEIFKVIAETGTRDVVVQHLNSSPYIKSRLIPVIKRQNKDIQDAYFSGYKKDSVEKMEDTILKFIEKYNLNLVGGGVMTHKKATK